MSSSGTTGICPCFLHSYILLLMVMKHDNEVQGLLLRLQLRECCAGRCDQFHHSWQARINNHLIQTPCTRASFQHFQAVIFTLIPLTLLSTSANSSFISLFLSAFLLLSSLSLPFLAQLCDCAALPQLTPMHAVFLCLLSLIPLDLPDE